jgi:hypothetical protein
MALSGLLCGLDFQDDAIFSELLRATAILPSSCKAIAYSPGDRAPPSFEKEGTNHHAGSIQRQNTSSRAGVAPAQRGRRVLHRACMAAAEPCNPDQEAGRAAKDLAQAVSMCGADAATIAKLESIRAELALVERDLALVQGAAA